MSALEALKARLEFAADEKAQAEAWAKWNAFASRTRVIGVPDWLDLDDDWPRVDDTHAAQVAGWFAGYGIELIVEPGVAAWLAYSPMDVEDEPLFLVYAPDGKPFPATADFLLRCHDLHCDLGSNRWMASFPTDETYGAPWE